LEERTRKKKHPIKTAILIVLAVVVIFALAAAGAFWYYNNALEPIAPDDESFVTVEVEAGSGTQAIGELLEEKGLIRSAFIFKLHSRLAGNDGTYKIGSYELSRSMSMDELMAEIALGSKADVKRFTIPEGYNILQVTNRLVEEGIVTEADLREELENGVFDYAFLEDIPDGADRLEGFLYPETYEVFATATAHDVIDKMLAQFDKLYPAEYYDKAAAMDFSVRDIVTMASIIERESKTAEERPVMAGVFYNRLDIGMKLESCATIQYILGEPKEFLTYDDLAIESPYNSYLHEGLPPGPICSPRMASVEAALYPDDNDFIYFVVSPKLDGTHNFSADYNKFLKDKEAYNAAVANRKN
jgi:UPF0755 protein